jgi:hypothetical protein
MIFHHTHVHQFGIETTNCQGFFGDHPISRHGELFVNENVDEPMDFGDHQLRPNPGIIV